MRRRHRASQQFHGLDALLRKEQPSTRIGSITGGEERQPVRVIPMQMAEQDRAPKRRATEDAGEVAQTGTCVENQRRKGVILADRDARRMAAHVVELRTDRGSRSTRTAYPYVHDQASSRRWPADNASSASRSICALATAAILHGVIARRVDVRRPPSSAARSPTTAPGPSSASTEPSTSTASTPSSNKNSSSPTRKLDEVMRER